MLGLLPAERNNEFLVQKRKPARIRMTIFKIKMTI